MIKDDRCTIPRELFNDIAAIATASKKANCEVQVEAISYWLDCPKNRGECLALKERGMALPEGCKCSEY